MSSYGPRKLSALDDSQRGWSKPFVVAIVLVVAGVVLVPVTFFTIYELNGRYCNDANTKVVSDAWLDLASDSRTHGMTTAPEPGCRGRPDAVRRPGHRRCSELYRPGRPRR